MNILMVYVVAIFLEGIPAFCIGMAMGWKIGCREADEEEYYQRFKHSQINIEFAPREEADEDDQYHEYRHDQRDGMYFIPNEQFDLNNREGGSYLDSGPFDFRSPMGRPVAGDSHRGAEAETES